MLDPTVMKISDDICDLLQKAETSAKDGIAAMAYTIGISAGISSIDPDQLNDIFGIIRSAYMLGRNSPEADAFKQQQKRT